MSTAVNLRLSDEQFARLEQAAHQLGYPPAEAAALFLEEALRQREFPAIEFRDSAVGRQAYLTGTRVTVWQIVWLVRSFDGDQTQVAVHLQMPLDMVRAALTYAAAFPAEIDGAIAENSEAAAHLEQLMPDLQVFTADAATS